jgi:hypothetical protein
MNMKQSVINDEKFNLASGVGKLSITSLNSQFWLWEGYYHM